VSSSAPATARCSAAPEAGRGGARAVPHRRAARPLHESAKAICREAGYHGAGTVEFLVGQDGTISFLEVNTRLQVEHPVTEETTGIDLVREQFRIADGEPLGSPRTRRRAGTRSSSGSTPRTPAATSCPRPARSPAGAARRARACAGLRRRDRRRGGGGAFDSLLAKLIVTGATREEALERSRRALDEFVVEGMPTVLPFHRAVVRDPAFTSEPFTVHTRWIETEWDNQVPPYGAAPAEQDEDRARGRPSSSRSAASGSRCRCRPARRRRRRRPAGGRAPPRKRGGGHGGAAASGDALTAPMQGTIVKVAVEDGDTVAGRRPGRRPRGDEDGAADHRAQGRSPRARCWPRSSSQSGVTRLRWASRVPK
jgi:acetyl-CoA/propionyl-CoA carboxylase biotin carboxyl carrier protein